MVRKTILDNWLDDVKRRNLNYTDLRREITNISDSHNSRYRTVYLKLNGHHPAVKANTLIEQWRTEIPVTNTTEVEEKDDYIYDSNCVVPIGHIFNVDKIDKCRYKLISIKDNNTTIQLVFNAGKEQKDQHTVNYNLSTLNQNIKSGQWSIYQPNTRTQRWLKEFKFPPNVILKEKFIKENGSLLQFTGTLPVSRQTIYLNIAATGNCQLSIIGHANTLLNSCTKEEVSLQLREVKKLSGKRLLLMDLQQNYIKQLKEKVPANHIVSVTPYKSTNGSAMNLVLLNIDTI